MKNEEDLKENEEAPAGPTNGGASRAVSERKVQANRENAKKSTGPTTERGKHYSSFNALKHGLLAKKIMFTSDGKLASEDLQRVFENLREGYGCGDVARELLVELAVTDYWRLQKGLEYEFSFLGPGGGGFLPEHGLPILLRYQIANRRAFDKSLQMLMEMRMEKEPARVATVDDPDLPELAAAPPTTRRPPKSEKKQINRKIAGSAVT
jgi:hypothetical protein